MTVLYSGEVGRLIPKTTVTSTERVLVFDDDGNIVTATVSAISTGSSFVGVTSADTTPSFLDTKVSEGSGITTTILNPGANESLEFTVDLVPSGGLAFSSGQLDISPTFVDGLPAITTLQNTDSLIVSDSSDSNNNKKITVSDFRNELSVITTEGDIVRGDGSGNPERLAIGANGTILTSDGTTASWQSPAASTDEFVKITVADTTPGVLDNKLVVTTNITKTVLNPGADEDLQLDISALYVTNQVAITTTQGTDQILLADASDSNNTKKILVSDFQNEISVITTQGDVVTGDASGNPQRLGLGTNGQILTSNGTDVIWQNPAAVADEFVKVSVADTTSGFLNAKAVGGDGIVTAILNPAADEDLEFSVDLAASSGLGFVTNQLRVDPNLVSIQTAVATLDNADQILLADNSDSDTNKKITVTDFRNQLSVITTEGDLIVGNGSGNPSRIGIGTNNQVLTSNGTTATWQTIAATTDELVKISATDTTAGFLDAKLIVTTNLTKTIINPAADEDIQLDISALYVNNQSAITTIENADQILIADNSDSDNSKKILISDFRNELFPITTQGDVITGDASGDPQRLALGTNGQVLTSNGTDAIWSSPAASTDEFVKVTASDTTPGVLDAKIIPGDGLVRTVLNPAADEDYQLDVDIFPAGRLVFATGQLAVVDDLIANVDSVATVVSGDFFMIQDASSSNEDRRINFDDVRESITGISNQGSLSIGDGGGDASELLIGALGAVLTSNGTTASWQAPVVDPDEQVKITASDTTSGFLDAKLVVTTNLTKTVLNPAADEDLQIDISSQYVTNQTAITTLENTDQVIVADASDSNNTKKITISDLRNELSVITTRGDVITGDVSGDPQRLALGTNGQVLTSDGTDAIWQSPALGANDRVGITGADTTPDFLDSKIVAGNGIDSTVLTPGGNEDLQISARLLASGGLDFSASQIRVIPTFVNIQSAITSLQDTDELLIADASGANVNVKITVANFRNELSPVTTRGDVITGGVSGDPQRLALGTSGQVLTSDGTDAVWQTPAGSTDELVKISATDTTSGFLDAKLLVTTNLTKTILNPAADEDIQLDISNQYVTNQTAITTIQNTDQIILADASDSNNTKKMVVSDFRNELSVITTQGDIITGNVSGNPQRVPIGASGTVVKSDGTDTIFTTHTLQNAFDQGNTIDVATADSPLTVDATGTTTPFAITGQAVAPTTSLVSGGIYYDTTTQKMYAYDTTRSKWLSVEQFNLDFTDNGANNGQYLRIGNALDANAGWRVPFDCTIIHIMGQSVGGDATKAFDIEIDGVVNTTINFAANIYTDTAADIDVNAGQRLSVFATLGATAITDPNIVFYIKYRM